MEPFHRVHVHPCEYLMNLRSFFSKFCLLSEIGITQKIYMSHGVQINQNVNVPSWNKKFPYHLIELGLVTFEVSIYCIYAYNIAQDYICNDSGAYGHDSMSLRSISIGFHAVERWKCLLIHTYMQSFFMHDKSMNTLRGLKFLQKFLSYVWMK